MDKVYEKPKFEIITFLAEDEVYTDVSSGGVSTGEMDMGEPDD